MQNDREPDALIVRGGDPGMPPREAFATEVILAQLMLPSDANTSGNVHGGTLMKIADTAGGIAASRHARKRVVTVVVDSMTFEQPAYVGDLVTFHGRVTWVGRTSIETEVRIEAENVVQGSTRRISTAFFVYVALDAEGNTSAVPPLALSGADALAKWDAAERRREHRIARRA